MSAQITRRAAVGAAFGIATARKGFTYPARARRVEVDAGTAGATIRPELHSHFAEHLGSCTYGGLWVGADSPVPNIRGYRKQAVEYLRTLGVPVLRWPGGCFADDYHWRDGIGPAAKRPRRVNIWWGGYTEDNSFGTHEFIGLCRLIGAEPYVAGNVGSGTPSELRDWVEYCNYPSGSSLAAERAANGSAEPFRVRYWGVGNENWGCGGRMTPEEYAGHYRRFTTFLRPFGGTEPFLIACGPSGNDLDWSRRFFATEGRRSPVHGFAMHFYSGGKSNAANYTVATMREQLSSFVRLEQAILDQRTLLDQYDPEGRIGLLVDEWGVWDRMVPDEEKRYGRLWQQGTMRSAVAAALGLNVFHRQAQKLYMCNIAQIVNVLQSVLLTEGARCIRTPNYYAFLLMKPHRGNSSLRVANGDNGPLGLSVSASRKERRLVLSFVNPLDDEEMQVDCAVSGAALAGGTAQILHHPDWNACNTFERPDMIVPQALTLQVARTGLKLELPPLSVAAATLETAG